MKMIGLKFALLTTAVLWNVGIASAVTVDITGAAINNYDPMPANYGSASPVTISYSTLDGGNNWGQFATVFSNIASYWAVPNYTGDQAVFAQANGKKLQIHMDVAPGYHFTSFGFGIGAYPDSSLSADFKFFDGSWNQLWTGNFLFGGGGVVGLGVSSLNLGSFVDFQLGDNWNVGVTSINYEFAKNVSSVPLPAGLPLLAAGIVGLAGAARRRKKAA